jgi:outer membrane protein OmpA-like peptidoglycan-associated protein
MITKGLPPNFADLAGGMLGESGATTKGALAAALPALLGSVAHAGATPDGSQRLMSMLSGPSVDTGILNNIGGLLSGGGQANSMMTAGAGMLQSLLGDKAGAFTSALASSTGMRSTQSATNLLGLLLPLVLGFIKRYVNTNGLSASGLSSLLGSQGQFLQGAIDGKLANALGYANPSSMLGTLTGAAGAAGRAVTGAAAGAAGAMGAAAGAAGRAASDVAGAAAGAAGRAADSMHRAGTVAAGAAADAAVEGGSFVRRWLPWIIGILVILWLLWWALSKTTTTAPPPAPAATAPPKAVAAAPAVPTALPAKIYFDSGSVVIGENGKAAVDAVAQLVKAAGGSVTITGYADSSGDPAQNAEIAKNRAKAVRDALVASGIAESTLIMVPPVAITGTGGDAEARRVEVAKAP